ncbi:MAG: hypothetical protein JXA44_01660 [Methanospirillaceae archaeon]|nr:hypothetical protein [Methanospirillaceae archaeon]
MVKINPFLIGFVILLFCLVPCVMAGLPKDRVASLSAAKDITVPVVCNQPYTLCDTAYCVPSQSDPKTVLCSCFMIDGVSLGGNSCSVLAPVGMYVNEDGEWMIKAGYPVGQITSTYSFYQAAPIPGREIDPNTTASDYTGTIYLKHCTNGDWADCWNKPCSVLPKDITADINTDREAADYAVCDCGLVTNSPEWYIAVYGTEQCTDENLCSDYIISGSPAGTMDAGIALLKKYLLEHPDADPAQQYAMGYCEECTEGE